eukprot:scaffold25065_cov129-Isochrysis_galbana.AAC.4
MHGDIQKRACGAGGAGETVKGRRPDDSSTPDWYTSTAAPKVTTSIHIRHSTARMGTRTDLKAAPMTHMTMRSVSAMTRGSETKVAAAPSICSSAMPVKCISPTSTGSPGKLGSSTTIWLASRASRIALIHFWPMVEKGSKVVVTLTLVAVRSALAKASISMSPHCLASGVSSSSIRIPVHSPPWIITPEKSDAGPAVRAHLLGHLPPHSLHRVAAGVEPVALREIDGRGRQDDDRAGEDCGHTEVGLQLEKGAGQCLATRQQGKHALHIGQLERRRTKRSSGGQQQWRPSLAQPPAATTTGRFAGPSEGATSAAGWVCGASGRLTRAFSGCTVGSPDPEASAARGATRTATAALASIGSRALNDACGSSATAIALRPPPLGAQPSLEQAEIPSQVSPNLRREVKKSGKVRRSDGVMVSAPTMAKTTVEAAAMPIVEMVETGINSMPRKHRNSVDPEMRTVCPLVWSVTTSASSSEAPACTSSPKRVSKKSE